MIGQQWQFTYRYPRYGGVETTQLVLPANQLIELHVTSLDAVHSFWAYELGVKADANPSVDNVVYVNTRDPRSFSDPVRRALRALARLHVRHGQGRHAGRVRGVDRGSSSRSSQADRRATCRPTATTYNPDPHEEGRMRLRRLVGFNLLFAIVLGCGRLLPRLVARPPDQREEPRLLRRHGPERRRAVPRLPARRGRLPRRARLPQLPARAHGRAPASLGELKSTATPRLDAVPRLLHRPQGGRAAVPDRDRLLPLPRRRQRDADPLRAPATAAERLPGRPVPDARRPARHDDDGDDDERDPRPVRQLLPAAA